jgi:hypothetical protein
MLSGAAEKLRDDRSALPFPVERERLDRWQRAARKQMGDGVFDHAYLEGKTMSLQDALRLCSKRSG